jgi:predicted phage terminase large subunit-like protein
MNHIPKHQFLSLWDFFSKVFVPLNRLELPLKPLHKHVCDTLEKAILGNLGKSFLVINIPPRVGKTKMVEAATAWLLAYFPDSQIIYVSYSNELAKTSVRYVQETMGATWYQDLFETRLGNIRQADHFTTTHGGKVYGDGVGGSLTGLGAGLKRRAGGFIVLDDPSKPDEAMSRVETDKLKFWVNNTLLSRRNSSQWTPIVCVSQRLSTDDLPGFLLENYPNDTELIKFPAIVNGESVIPETITTKELLDIERVNPFSFASQYMQNPIVLGGNLIKLADFKYYDVESPPKFELKIMTCDTALKSKESNDYSVVQCWGKSMKRAFLIDQIRGKWSPTELLNNTSRFYAKHHKASSPMSYIAIEEAAAGYNLMMEMRKKGIPAKGIVRLTDKVSRVMTALPYQATGMVYLPKTANWLAAFEVEAASFRADGKSTHDDQVDAMTDGISLLLGKGTSILNVLGSAKPQR